MYHYQFMGMDEIIDCIQSVTLDDVIQTANEMFQPEAIAVTVLGNLNGLKLTRDSLAC
jgi:predicted Zn-dependent peptidase